MVIEIGGWIYVPDDQKDYDEVVATQCPECGESDGYGRYATVYTHSNAVVKFNCLKCDLVFEARLCRALIGGFPNVGGRNLKPGEPKTPPAK